VGLLAALALGMLAFAVASFGVFRFLRNRTLPIAQP